MRLMVDWRPIYGPLWAVGVALALSAATPVPVRAQSEVLEEVEAVGADTAPPQNDVDIDVLLAEVDAALGLNEPSSPAAAPEGTPPDSETPIEALLADHAEASWEDLRGRIEDRFTEYLLAVGRRIPPEVSRFAAELASGDRAAETRFAVLCALATALLVVLTLLLLRGQGDLAVCIEYPAELRGSFTVRIANPNAPLRKEGRIASPAAAQRAKRRARASSRMQHHLVSRETRFPGIRSGRYQITVDGFLQARDGEEVLATHFQEQEITVRRGRTVRAEFDFHPRECPVDVKVLWDNQPAAEALVALRGVPYSLRYARSGPVRLGVSRGSHTLIVGSGDRVAEQAIEVTSFEPTRVVVELAERDKLLFAGCPPAVEPYLNGDVQAAALALERDGQGELAHLLLARLHQERNDQEAAARHFEQAGRHLDAAEIHQSLSQFERSAVLFESAGEITRAAKMYESAGDHLRAGEAYQQVNQHDLAAECFREAGDVQRWVEALENSGAPFEAGRAALEHGDRGRAIRSLQTVSPTDPHYVDAVNLLADLYQGEGHHDLASRKIEEMVAARGEGAVPLETFERLSNLLEEGGEYARALEALEVIRSRDATYPNVATRIEELRKRRSAEQGTTPALGAPAGGAFTSEFRYEILEELGRGGMGIVFKARDRRLGRVVAFKRMPDNLRNHPKAIELFLREARAAAALNHANIVTLFDAGQEGDAYYITMELLEGLPLGNILSRRGRLKPRDVARLGVQVANGLSYAHEQRIVHRDIKTGNLFLTKGKVLKIMDFGLAKMVEEVRRASTVIGGTPYFMAPEQSLGEAVDHRADIYALGVTFFELLTGKVPFADGDVAYHHRHTPPPDPRERAEGIPDAMAELVLEMLAKSPDDRCATAAIVAERLQEIARSLV